MTPQSKPKLDAKEYIDRFIATENYRKLPHIMCGHCGEQYAVKDVAENNNICFHCHSEFPKRKK